MKTAGRILFFLAIFALSALALLFLLPGWKEGVSQDQLPALLAGVLMFLALAVLWWWASGGSLRRAAVGWIVLALPLIAYGAQATALMAAWYQGHSLADAVTVENYSETPIEWPGFDGPVGLTIEFDLVHPDGTDAIILPPEIRMAPLISIPRTELAASRTNGSGYFKDNHLDKEVGDLALLKTVLFQRHYARETAGDTPEKWLESVPFAPGGRTRLTYHLHPGAVDFLSGPELVCLSTRTHGSRVCLTGEDPKQGCTPTNWLPVENPIYAQGPDMTALWMAAGESDMVADLGLVLTGTLRRQSRLQGDPEGWIAMQKRLEPDGLRAAGYRICAPGPDSHTSFRTCYCRDDEE